MDPFALAMLGLLVGGILWVILVGKFSSRRGLEEAMGWKSAREVMERREALDVEDVNEMIAARNARRRARGERGERRSGLGSRRKMNLAQYRGPVPVRARARLRLAECAV